jgi:hypothetical protein
MTIGKINKAVRFVNGHRDEATIFFVSCCNCLGAEQSVPFTTKARFTERLKKEGWFQRNNGKWDCGRHGRDIKPECEWVFQET